MTRAFGPVEDDAELDWITSVDKLCDHWSEWDGMRELVEAVCP